MAGLDPGLASGLPDRYALERELGRGGMATVYLARDRKLERRVALKVLHRELAVSVGAVRFAREIMIAAQLTHPHILPVLDSGEAGGFLFYTMPYVAGGSLRDRLTRERQLPLDDALAITAEVADALSCAHGQGIVHRDIKPENILFESGHAVVSDFGIARAIGAAGGQPLTETGLTVGTPAYMSPEQAVGDPDLDGRSDLYSLGCVLYEMLGGEAPYTGPTPQAVLAKRLNEPVPHIRTLRETVPPAVELAITTVLAKTPADRFATARQFVGALCAAPDDTNATLAGKRHSFGLQLYVMNADGTGLTRLTLAHGQEETPPWWPDRDGVAFLSLGDRGARLFAMNADGSWLKQLTAVDCVGSRPGAAREGRRTPGRDGPPAAVVSAERRAS